MQFEHLMGVPYVDVGPRSRCPMVRLVVEDVMTDAEDHEEDPSILGTHVTSAARLGTMHGTVGEEVVVEGDDLPHLTVDDALHHGAGQGPGPDHAQEDMAHVPEAVPSMDHGLAPGQHLETGQEIALDLPHQEGRGPGHQRLMQMAEINHGLDQETRRTTL